MTKIHHEAGTDGACSILQHPSQNLPSQRACHTYVVHGASAPPPCSAGATSRTFFWKLPHGINFGNRLRARFLHFHLILSLTESASRASLLATLCTARAFWARLETSMHCNLSIVRGRM